MSIEAMKQALEALDTCMYPQQKQMQAITSLRQAISEAEKQEPAVYIPADALRQITPPLLILRGVSLYGYLGDGLTPLYTHPQPKRKPLTRGQIREIEVDVSLNPSFDYITPAEQLCRAIEAAHGIKE